VFAPGHLAVALIDQADAGVVRLLSDAHIEPAAVRAAALEMLGAPEGLAPVPYHRCARPGPTIGRPCPSPSWTLPYGLSWCGARSTCLFAVSSARATGTPFRTLNTEPPGALPSAGLSTMTSATRFLLTTVTGSRPWPTRHAPISSRHASSAGSATRVRCLS
jgi:hypothetical protein